MSELNMLVEMGFEMKGAAHALQMTGNQGVEAAMEWLLAHPDAVIPDSQLTEDVKLPSNIGNPSQEPDTQTSNESVATEEEVNSIKCEECGKSFKNNEEVEFHAVKTGHTQFTHSTEKIKPLTEEEKQERMKRVEEMIRLRRLDKEEQVRKENIEKEKVRRKEGQELLSARQRLQEEEMKRMADLIKKEKLEAKEARQRVLDQIERDKLDRQKLFGSGPKSVETVAASSTNQETLPQLAQNKTYDQCRIQIRLTNGQTLVQNFGPKETLSAVRLYIELNRTDGEGPFGLMTTFPRKVFSEEEMDAPLTQLGLVPSAVIIVTKQAA